jgi:ABC-type branched-subunit amino acid transport system substrate-binding protein
MTTNRIPSRALFALAAAFAMTIANAQTVRIGLLSTYSGPNAQYGENVERGMRLYMKLNADKLPPGVKVELVPRDDGGPNPDKAKQLAQELIIRDKVNLLAGFIWTPNALAVAPLVTEAKMPTVIVNAASSQITTRSPYFERFSFTEWQFSYPLGQWDAKRHKRAYTLVSDFAPGHDAEEAFEKGFAEGGGQVIGKVRAPLSGLDFVPFMQRAKDAKPDVVYAFVPAGRLSVQVMKAFVDLGLDKAGIKLIGSGNITTDEELANMGDVTLAPSRPITTRWRRSGRPTGRSRRASRRNTATRRSPISRPSPPGTRWTRSTRRSVHRVGVSTPTAPWSCCATTGIRTVRAVRSRSIRKLATSCRTSISGKCVAWAVSSPTSSWR